MSGPGAQALSASVPVYVCARCGEILTRPVWRQPRSIPLKEGPEEELLPSGFWADHEGGVGINRADLLRWREHPDPERWIGCCGPDGHGKPNALCINGHDVGWVIEECYTPAYAKLLPAAVRIVDQPSADWRVLQCKACHRPLTRPVHHEPPMTPSRPGACREVDGGWQIDGIDALVALQAPRPSGATLEFLCACSQPVARAVMNEAAAALLTLSRDLVVDVAVSPGP